MPSRTISGLRIFPLTLSQANALVDSLHQHNKRNDQPAESKQRWVKHLQNDESLYSLDSPPFDSPEVG